MNPYFIERMAEDHRHELDHEARQRRLADLAGQKPKRRLHWWRLAWPVWAHIRLHGLPVSQDRASEIGLS